MPICPLLRPEPRGPGWVVCGFHISINPICFFFFLLLFTLLKIYFHMEQKSAHPPELLK